MGGCGRRAICRRALGSSDPPARWADASDASRRESAPALDVADLSRHQLRHGRRAAKRTRSMWRWKFSAARKPAGSIARWWKSSALAVSAGASANTSGLGGGQRSVWAHAGGRRVAGAAGSGDRRGDRDIPARWADRGGTGAREVVARRRRRSIRATARRALANIYGASLAQGETIDAIVDWPDDIEAVTREEVMAMARETLDIERVRHRLAAAAGGGRNDARALMFACSLAPFASPVARRRTPKRSTQHGVPVERIVSPGGIEAWLVSDSTVPMIVLRAYWRGGSAIEPRAPERRHRRDDRHADRRRGRSRRQRVQGAAGRSEYVARLLRPAGTASA